MATIGVRELRRDASRWLARVRGGETFIVTDRGRPVARLVPLPEAKGYSALIEAGGLSLGPGRDTDSFLSDLDAELPPDTGPSMTAALAELRDGER